MLRIAGQTAGPIGLKLFVNIYGWPGGCYRLKKSNFFSKIFKMFKKIFFPRATPGPSASNEYYKTFQYKFQKLIFP